MITIVFGKPGAGKTAFITSDAVHHMDFSEECQMLHDKSIATIYELNSNGASFSLPDRSPVYTNYKVSFKVGLAEVTSYYIDGFHLGFENDDVPVYSVYPGSRIYLSEAQRYYNSRKSRDLPDWVSRYYEEHRHFNLDIFLDVQRPGLIDINIRELCGRFLEIDHINNKLDSMGRILYTDFYIREFEDWKYVEKYLSGFNNCFRELIYRHEGNVFECFRSQSYFSQFVPSEQFASFVHPLEQNTMEDAELSRMLYQQSPPSGFYPDKRRYNG